MTNGVFELISFIWRTYILCGQYPGIRYQVQTNIGLLLSSTLGFGHSIVEFLVVEYFVQLVDNEFSVADTGKR